VSDRLLRLVVTRSGQGVRRTTRPVPGATNAVLSATKTELLGPTATPAAAPRVPCVIDVWTPGDENLIFTTSPIGFAKIWAGSWDGFVNSSEA